MKSVARLGLAGALGMGLDFVSAAQPAKKAFEGSTVTLHLVSDQLQIDLQTQCDSPNKKLGTTWNFTRAAAPAQ